MMDSKRILFNHDLSYDLLSSGLGSRNIACDKNNWSPSATQLSNTIACVIWFYDVLRHPLKVYKLKKLLNARNIPVVAWNRDAPHYLNRKAWRLNLFNNFHLLDIYATHTLIDSKRTFANKVIYLPNAANSARYNLRGSEKEVFTSLRDNSSYKYDVSFFGGMDGSHYKEDIQRENFFKAISEKLERLNISYKFIDTVNSSISLEQQIALIQTSRINLNYGARCEYQAPIASGLPERSFGIPATGGFLLSDYRTHNMDAFSVGTHMDEFNSLDECVEKINYYLNHFNLSRDMAEKCYHHVMEHHTYFNRSDSLLDVIYTWRGE